MDQVQAQVGPHVHSGGLRRVRVSNISGAGERLEGKSGNPNAFPVRVSQCRQLLELQSFHSPHNWDLLILELFSDERLRFSQPARAAGSTTAARPHKEQPAPNMTAMEESQAPGLCPGSPHSGAVGLEPRNSRPRATQTAVDYEGGRTGRAASDPPLNHTAP